MAYPLVFNAKNDKLVFLGPFEPDNTKAELQFFNPGNTKMHWKVKVSDNAKFKLQRAIGEIDSGEYQSVIIDRTPFQYDPVQAQKDADEKKDKILILSCFATGKTPTDSFASPKGPPTEKILYPYFTENAKELVKIGGPPSGAPAEPTMI